MAIAVLLLLTIHGLKAQYNFSDLLPTDPSVRIGKLPNGLSYYIRKNGKPEKKAELRLVVNAGSVLEDADQLGLAHFMEHMNFNGSKNFPKNELVEYLQSIGVEFGADLNAYTGFDETVYILPVPADNPEKLEKAFTILEDWAGHAQLDIAEIEKERGVVLEESRIGRGANERMRNAYFPVLYYGSLYADRLPIGKDSILRNFNPEVLNRYYHDWYRPELMAIIVVGDIDPVVIEQKIKTHFSGFKNPPDARRRPEIIDIPVRRNNQALVLTDKEQPYGFLSIYHSLEKSLKVVNWKDYRETEIQTLFNKMLVLRFEELTQQAKPPFIFGGSYSENSLRGYKVHTSFALLGDNPVDEAVNALVQTIESAKQHGFLISELNRAKSNLLNEAERALINKDKTESPIFTELYINHFLSGSPIISPEERVKYLKYALPGIGLEEVNNFARSLIKKQGVFVLVQAPEKIKSLLPADSGLIQMVTKATIAPVKPFTENKIASSLLTQSPKKGKIISETTNPKTGTIELQLSNGASVSLKPTDFKNDEIIMEANRKGGYYNYPTKDIYNAKNAAMIVTEMGVGAFSPSDLRKFLSGKTIQASPYISTVEEGISGNSSVKDAEELFQMVYLYFTQPAKKPELFQSYISKQKGFIQNMKNDPASYFEDTLIRVQFNNHPWTETYGDPADYDKINLDRCYAIYREIFNNAYGMHFTFVGNIDPVKFKTFVEQYIASLPSKPKENHSKDVGLRPVRGIVEVQVRKGAAEDKKSMVKLLFAGETPYSYEAFLHQQALIDVINIIIIRELREEISGIYGGGMFGYLQKRPYQQYFISTSFPCGPENTDKLTELLLGIIQRIKQKGCDQADLDKIKESWKNQRRERIRQNNYWARQLSYMRVNDEDPAVFLTHDSILDKISVTDIQTAARKYLDESNYIRGVLYPEK